MQGAGKLRQGALVPENIFHRRAEFFRHRYYLHFIFREFKQRQVFLQHEQNKMVFIRVGQEKARSRANRYCAMPVLPRCMTEVEMPIRIFYWARSLFEIIYLDLRSPSPLPNDSLAPAHSALAGLRLRPDSFHATLSGEKSRRGWNFAMLLASRLQGSQSSVRNYFVS